MLSHEPVFIDSISSLVNVHGHTHDTMVTEDYFTGEYNTSYPKQKVDPAKYINVCMDANNFRIMSLKEILSKIENS